MNFARPRELDEALALLQTGRHQVLAGATDVYPADANRQAWGRRPLSARAEERCLDVSNIESLKHIKVGATAVEIGAGVTWTQALECDLPGWFDGVRLAAREVGGNQIQNRGTIAGNLCNASPAADGVPPLMALDARVRLQTVGRSREVPLSDFITGNRATTLAEDELMTAIVIPIPAPGCHTTFLKLGARRFLVISIAMVAARLDVSHGRIELARVAVGACGPVTRRLSALETRLEGQTLENVGAMVTPADLEALTPIDDVRATAHYRKHAAGTLVARALDELAAKARAKS